MLQQIPAVPLNIFKEFRLSEGARLEIVKTPEGFNKVDVISNGKMVATLTTQAQTIPISRLQRLCAANGTTLDSHAGRKDQWWDDDLLNEPLEPLAEFE